jgi:hypothetical protein
MNVYLVMRDNYPMFVYKRESEAKDYVEYMNSSWPNSPLHYVAVAFIS